MLIYKNKILPLSVISFFLLTGWANNWDDIKSSAKKIKSIEAEFVQIKHMKILTKPLISRGSFLYKVPGSLRWEYVSPIKSILLMSDGYINRYIKYNNRFIKASGKSLQAMGIILKEITLWLNGNFNKNPDFIARLEKNRGTVRIILVPRNESLLKLIKEIDIKLSKNPGVIESISIYETKENYTLIKFKNVKLNKKLDASRFREI